jgi:hypothetical protein
MQRAGFLVGIIMLLGTSALVSIFTMFFVTVLYTVKILSNKNM